MPPDCKSCSPGDGDSIAIEFSEFVRADGRPLSGPTFDIRREALWLSGRSATGPLVERSISVIFGVAADTQEVADLIQSAPSAQTDHSRGSQDVPMAIKSPTTVTVPGGRISR